MPITKAKCKKKTREMISLACKTATKKIERAINSGAIDLKQWEDDYALPKIIAYVLLQDAVFQIKPLSKENMKEAENLEKFI